MFLSSLPTHSKDKSPKRGQTFPDVMITIEDIARKSGFSVSTVSRVLNRKAGKHRISGRTQELILRVAEEFKYRPNQLARSLRLKQTHAIGLIVPDISNPFFAYVTRSIQTSVHRMGYSLVVCDTDENLDLEIEHTNLLLSKGVDGLIIMPVGQSCEHLRKVRKEGIPFVLVDRTFDELEASSVVVDNYRGAFEAVEHLIAHGHTKIGIIQGLPNTSTNTGRLKGYLDALAKHGITPAEELMVGNSFRTESGYVETKVLLSIPSPPTAIFATSDLITLGVLEAIEEENLSIPNDISLVVFDEVDFGPFLKCPLTTVAQPKENMGELAVKILVDQLKSKQKKETKHIVLKPTLVKRDSVKDVPSTRGLAGEPLTVATPVSASS